MKTTVRCSFVRALLGVLLFQVCASAPAQKPPRNIAGEVADHPVAASGSVAAHDLDHGVAAARLRVARTWLGKETLNTHFGPGWSDANEIRLTLIDRDTLIIWRGGVGWHTAYRKDGKAFAGAGGETIRSTDTGWIAERPKGGALLFDGDGRLITDRPATGPACNYTYDKNGRLLSIGTSPENVLQYQYDRTGKRVVRVDGPEGLRLEYNYDKSGRLVGLTNARKVRIEYRYSNAGELIGIKDQFGVEFTPGPPTKVSSAPLDAQNLPALSSAKEELDEQGRVRSETRGGQKVSYQRDKDGRIEKIKSAAGETACTYDKFGRIASTIDPGGTITQFEYSNLDLPTRIASSSGGNQKITYDEHGRAIRREAAPDDWEEFVYDSAGRLEVERRAPAAETRYTYDDLDRPVRIKHASGAEVTFEYDSGSRPILEKWSTGETISRRYDAQGRLIETIDPAGLKTTYKYDKPGETISEDPVRGAIRILTQEFKTTVDGPAGRSIDERDAWGRLLARTLPGNRKTVLRYNAAGTPEIVLTPGGTAWRYGSDKSGRLAMITSPSGLRTTLGRDAGGRVTSTVRGNVNWRKYRYNKAGQLEEISSAAGRVAAYQYDAAGKVQEIELPSGKITLTKEANGRKSTTVGPGYRIEEEFNADGSLARRLYQPAGLELKLPLDNNGRAAGIALNNLKASYNYNAKGQLDRIDLPGGQNIQIARDAAGRPTSFVFGKAATFSIGYDKADRITNLEAKKTGDNKVLFAESYSYGGVGNVAEIKSGAETRKFEYDKENRLTKITGPKPHSFEYDGDGNLRRMGPEKARWTLDKLGRPLEAKGTRYTWNASGNLTKTATGPVNVQNQFDAADRLVRRIDGKKTWSYGYLPSGDRLWIESAEGKSWAAYLPNGLVGLKDATGIAWLMVYLPGTDWPLALCGSNGKTFFAIADRLYSSRRYLDTSGAVINFANFGPFGEPELGGASKPRGFFAGMVRDESGLYYARQRYYDPQIGRFISIDPELGSPEVPATHNLYAYAGNNPLRNRDPLGTDFASEVAADGNNLYHVLSDAQQAALKEAWDGAERARRILSSGMKSTASETAAAAQHLKECETAIAKIHEIAKATYKYSLLKNGPTTELSEIGKQNLERNLAQAKAELEALGEAPRVGRLALGENASKLGSTLQGTENAARLQAEAAERAAEKKAAGEAATKASTETAKRAGEEVAEGIGSKLWRAVKGLGPFLQILGAAADIHTIAETDYYAIKMYGAESDELKSRKLAKEMEKKLDDEIRRIAKEEPQRLGPMNDGRMPDPNNPDDIDQLIIDMHQNLWKKRPPFDGIIKPREEKPEDTTASKKAADDAAKNLADAIEAARKLIARGHEMEDSVRNAQAKAAKAEVEAKDAVQKATTVATIQGGLDFDVAAVPVAANTVKTETAAVKAQKEKLQAAYNDMVAAGSVCDAASATICGFAGQADGAAPEQIKAWQAQAIKTLQTASDKLNAAQAEIDSADVAIDELRSSTNYLQGFSLKLAAIRAAAKTAEITDNTSEGALAAATAANDQAQAARAEIPGLLSKIQGLAAQAKAVLQPFASDPQTAALMAEADALGTGLDDNTSIFDINALVRGAAPIVNPLVTLVKAATDALGSIDIDAIVTDAQSTLNDAEILRTSARALAQGPERYQSLQSASQCYARLKTAGEKAVAQTSPTPTPIELAAASPTPTEAPENPSPTPQASPKVAQTSPSPSGSPGSTDRGTMPNLIGLTLDQAVTRLSGKMRIGSDEAGDKPPTPEKAYTIFSQSPAPGAKLDPNKETVISVKRYGSAKSVVEQPPEETPPSSANADDFVGEWERGGKEGGSFAISKQGNTYYLSGGGEKPIPIKLENGTLVLETVLDFSGTVPTITGNAYGKDKDPAKMKIILSLSNGELNIDTTVTTNREGVKKSHQGPLRRKK